MKIKNINLSVIRTLLIALLINLFIANTTVHADTIKIQDIEMLESSQIGVPPESSPWQKNTLPFKINQDSEDIKHDYYWFKFNVKKPETLKPISLYFPKHQFDVQVFFNENYIGGTHAPKGKQASGWHHPLLVDIQNSNWKETNNQVAIRLSTGTPTTLLYEIYLGDSQMLNEIWRKQSFLHKQIAQISMVISIVASFISLIIWLYRKKETQYLLFSLLSAAWLIPLSTQYFSYAPISNEYYFKISTVSIDLSMLLLFLLINQGLDLKLERVAKILPPITLISSIAILFSSSLIVIKTIPFIIFVKISILIFSILLFLKKIKEYKHHGIWMLLSISIVVITISVDLYHYVIGSSGIGLYHAETYTRYLIPVYIVIFLAYLINNFLKTLSESEYLNLHLEEKVEKNRKELEKNYQEKRELELKEAEHLEKQRIYKDLHDDVGSKLVSILHSENQDTTKLLAKSALECLRESVSQVQNTNIKLSKIFEQIFEETQIRCANSNLKAHTNLNILNEHLLDKPITNLGYHLSRIIREGLTNILKHANAKNVYLDIILDNNALTISLRDDGTEFSETFDFGIGTSNMKYRAKELNGSIVWEKNPHGGCNVLFKLALKPV